MEVRTKEMDNSMMDLWPVDPGYIILGLAVLTLILLIIVIICLIQINQTFLIQTK